VSNTRQQALHIHVEAQRRLREAALFGTKARSPNTAMLCSRVRKRAGGLRLRAVGRAIGEDRARCVGRRGVDECAAGDVEAGIGERREDDMADDGIAGRRDDVDDAPRANHRRCLRRSPLGRSIRPETPTRLHPRRRDWRRSAA
jgi:hypothetical protein